MCVCLCVVRCVFAVGHIEFWGRYTGGLWLRALQMRLGHCCFGGVWTGPSRAVSALDHSTLGSTWTSLSPVWTRLNWPGVGADWRLSRVFRQDHTRCFWTGFSSDHFPPIFHPISCYVPAACRSNIQVFHVVVFPVNLTFHFTFPLFVCSSSLGWKGLESRAFFFLTGLVWLTITVLKEKVKLNI